MTVSKEQRRAHMVGKLTEICIGILETAATLDIVDIEFDVVNNLKRAGPATQGYEPTGYGTLILKVKFAPTTILPEPPVGIPIPPPEEINALEVPHE